MDNQKTALKILRAAGREEDDKLDLAETALALAALEKEGAPLRPYQDHLNALSAQIRASGPATRLEEQLRLLRQLLVVQHKYHGDEQASETGRASNLMDVIDRRKGSPLLLGILYLHVAHAAGWAMTGIDLSGHFLLRLSARDGQALIDPFRAGQTCCVEEIEDALLGEESFFDSDEMEEEEPFPQALLIPLTRREILLRLEHGVKRRHLAQDRVEPAIAVLQSMLIFAPQKQELWREIGYLQAERGHIRAAITALEVVRELTNEPMPMGQSDGFLRELRWRLN
jgi:regulator of sirC expression with transglutaminase-like and TPR domain